MEKISGILPSNSRIKSVDMKGAHPQRPGTPNFGQKMGTTSQDRMTLSQLATEKAMQESLATYNPREAKHAKIAEDMTRNFFDNRVGPELRETEAEDVRTGPTAATGRPAILSSSERALVKADKADAVPVKEGVPDFTDDVPSLDVYA